MDDKTLLAAIQSASSDIHGIGNACMFRDSCRAMAARIEELEARIRRHDRTIEILRHERNIAQARYEFTVRILSSIHSFLLPEMIRLPDGRCFVFCNEDIERQMFEGLCDAIRKVPEELRAAAALGEKP